MADRWSDVSLYQDPDAMLWHLWNIPRGQYRLIWGSVIDRTAASHRANMRLSDMLTGSYGVPVESTNLSVLADQARKWIDNTPDDDENDDWIDAERVNLTEPMLDAYCDTYDRWSTRQRLAIYTGFPWWTTHVPASRRERYVGYPLIIAGYPFDTPQGQPVPMDPASVALRSTPPTNRRPAIPPLWTVESGWQFSGQGSMPGYNKFLDMGIYKTNPGGGTVPPPTPTPDPDVVLKAAIRGHTAAIDRLVA